MASSFLQIFKLMDDFQEFVSSTPYFQIGFVEGRSSQQLIIAREYNVHVCKDDEITLWCDKKVDPLEQGTQSRKCKSTDTEDGTPASKASKADEHEQELLQIVDQLMSKYYTIPQLRLWGEVYPDKAT